MYGLKMSTGEFVRSEVISRELSTLECGDNTRQRRMDLLVEIESLESRGSQYSNHDFDVLSRALNFLDAVHPGHKLRGC